jgi:hypothetical protein
MAAFAHNWLRVSNHGGVGGEWRGCSLLVALSRDIDRGRRPGRPSPATSLGFIWVPLAEFGLFNA